MISRLGAENASAFLQQRRDKRVLLVFGIVPKLASSFSKVSFQGREQGPVCDLDRENPGAEVCSSWFYWDVLGIVEDTGPSLRGRVVSLCCDRRRQVASHWVCAGLSAHLTWASCLRGTGTLS